MSARSSPTVTAAIPVRRSGSTPRYQPRGRECADDEGGQVPGGKVDHALLQNDPTAPFGVRYDNGVVVSAFDDAWSDEDTVVLVEA